MFKFLTIIFLISVIIIPFAAFSDNADFKTGLNNNKLSPPGFGEGVTPDFLEYMGWALKILFFAVIISAVVMIVIGGLEYVIAGSTGNPENIKNAQNRMTMAIGGVLLALASWIILNTINPDLLKTDIKLPGVGGSNGGGKIAKEYKWVFDNRPCKVILGNDDWTAVDQENCVKQFGKVENATQCCGLFPGISEEKFLNTCTTIENVGGIEKCSVKTVPKCDQSNCNSEPDGKITRKCHVNLNQEEVEERKKKCGQ